MTVQYLPQAQSFPPPRLWFPGECEPFDTAFNPAKVIHVVDGDTMDLGVDLGRDVRDYAIRVRLTHEGWFRNGGKIGFNAWETRGPEKVRGDAAKARAESLLPVGSGVRTRSFKGGTRGSLYRWVDLILVCCRQTPLGLSVCDQDYEGAGWYSLADILLHEGHGREWWRGWKRGALRPAA